MIVLKRNGKPIAKATKPTWTHLQTNGYNISCDRGKADGVVVDGVQYSLAGKVGNGYDTVQIEEMLDDAVVKIEPTAEQKLQLAVAELGVAAEQSKTEVQLAIAELAETMTGGAE